MKNINNKEESLIDDIIKKFSVFLTENFVRVNEISTKSIFREHQDLKTDWLEDWIQVNWEMLVSHVICREDEFLSDYGTNVYRYYVPKNSEDKKKILEPYCISIFDEGSCDLLSGKNIKNIEKLDFISFIGKDNNNKFGNYPPFDYVALEGDNLDIFVFKINEIYFNLKEQ